MEMLHSSFNEWIVVQEWSWLYPNDRERNWYGLLPWKLHHCFTDTTMDTIIPCGINL